jgi:hypothetical protein
MIDYKRYRWFFTSSGKLVIGGKSAEQNDSLLNILKEEDADYILMHTSTPGSPFSVILEDIKDVSREDIEECAIFTGCFSKVWKSGKTKALVDIFKLSQLYKDKTMKQGTWGVAGDVEEHSVKLQLVLTKQKGILRAVPEQTAETKLVKILPGTIKKEDISAKLELELGKSLDEEELLSALPSGGFKIIK